MKLTDQEIEDLAEKEFPIDEMKPYLGSKNETQRERHRIFIKGFKKAIELMEERESELKRRRYIILRETNHMLIRQMLNDFLID